ncbi:hypothetical protein [Streptosporangium sp. NPDC001681]|uniref:hypothetical protein n=1 Tax=Streptosporangium sp. NPDC001681 TaxID=3154395 RepID=UPI003326A221
MSNWSGGTVERITPDGNRSTVAEVESPAGLAIDEAGNLYVSGAKQLRQPHLSVWPAPGVTDPGLL